MDINTNLVQPRKGFLLLEVPEKVTQTASGIALANNEGDTVPVQAKVLKAGEGCDIKEGQQILFRKYSVDEVKVKTETGEKIFWLLENDSVLAIIQ